MSATGVATARTVSKPSLSRLGFGGAALTRGLVVAYLSIIVLIPLAAVVSKSFENGLGAFWDAFTSPQAVAALKLTLGASAIVVAINALFGTIIAWVLVRDEFPGKKIVNSLIDLPFALPTIVAGITLLALYGDNGVLGLSGVAFTRIGVVMALLFVTLPFVIRSVQPVLSSWTPTWRRPPPRSAPARWTTFRKIILPEPPPGDPLGDRACLRPLDRRVRLAGPDLGQHPVQDRGRHQSSSTGRSSPTVRSPRPPSRSCCSRSRS